MDQAQRNLPQRELQKPSDSPYAQNLLQDINVPKKKPQTDKIDMKPPHYDGSSESESSLITEQKDSEDASEKSEQSQHKVDQTEEDAQQQEKIEEPPQSNQYIKSLESEIAKLKNVIYAQKQYQDKVESSQKRVVKNNAGYIGQIHQPVYNITMIQGQPNPHAPESLDQAADPRKVTSLDGANQSRFFSPQDLAKRPTSAALNSRHHLRKDFQYRTKNSRPLTSSQRRPASEDMQSLASIPGNQPQQSRRKLQRPKWNPRPAPSHLSFEDTKKMLDKGILAQSQSILESPPLQNMKAEDLQRFSQSHARKSQKLIQNQQLLKVIKEPVPTELDAIQEKILFRPQTNLNTAQGIRKTVSAFLDVTGKAVPFKKKFDAFSQANLLKGSSGKTSYVTYPNRSNYILEHIGDKGSAILDEKKELNIETKVLAGLKGCLDNEIKQNQKFKSKIKSLSSNTGAKSPSSPQKKYATLKGSNPLSPVDAFIKELERGESATINDEEAANQGQNSPTLRDTNHLKHIHLDRFDINWRWDWKNFDQLQDIDERDRYYNLQFKLYEERKNDVKTYCLSKGDQEIELDGTHFQPIFIAEDVETLSADVFAQQSLKKFKIFVGKDQFMKTFNSLTTKEFDILEQELKIRILKDKEDQERMIIEQKERRDKELKRIELEKQEKIRLAELQKQMEQEKEERRKQKEEQTAAKILRAKVSSLQNNNVAPIRKSVENSPLKRGRQILKISSSNQSDVFGMSGSVLDLSQVMSPLALKRISSLRVSDKSPTGLKEPEKNKTFIQRTTSQPRDAGKQLISSIQKMLQKQPSSKTPKPKKGSTAGFMQRLNQELQAIKEKKIAETQQKEQQQSLKDQKSNHQQKKQNHDKREQFFQMPKTQRLPVRRFTTDIKIRELAKPIPVHIKETKDLTSKKPKMSVSSNRTAPVKRQQSPQNQHSAKQSKESKQTQKATGPEKKKKLPPKPSGGPQQPSQNPVSLAKTTPREDVKARPLEKRSPASSQTPKSSAQVIHKKKSFASKMSSATDKSSVAGMSNLKSQQSEKEVDVTSSAGKNSNDTSKRTSERNIIQLKQAVLPAKMRPRSAKSDLDAVYNPKEGAIEASPERAIIESAKDKQSEKTTQKEVSNQHYEDSVINCSQKATPGLSFNMFLPQAQESPHSDTNGSPEVTSDKQYSLTVGVASFSRKNSQLQSDKESKTNTPAQGIINVGLFETDRAVSNSQKSSSIQKSQTTAGGGMKTASEEQLNESAAEDFSDGTPQSRKKKKQGKDKAESRFDLLIPSISLDLVRVSDQKFSNRLSKRHRGNTESGILRNSHHIEEPGDKPITERDQITSTLSDKNSSLHVEDRLMPPNSSFKRDRDDLSVLTPNFQKQAQQTPTSKGRSEFSFAHGSAAGDNQKTARDSVCNNQSFKFNEDFTKGLQESANVADQLRSGTPPVQKESSLSVPTQELNQSASLITPVLESANTGQPEIFPESQLQALEISPTLLTQGNNLQKPDEIQY